MVSMAELFLGLLCEISPEFQSIMLKYARFFCPYCVANRATILSFSLQD